jgi:NAD(P)-dependent dehydrogenase (short-subunit alcohol dehydrogenase family)
MAGSAIVTGGASGIGLALARQLVARGLKVVVADIDGDAAAAAAERLGVAAQGAQLDVADARGRGRPGRLDLRPARASQLPVQQRRDRRIAAGRER